MMGHPATLQQETDLRTAAEERYLSYALSVITSRALPDVRDGLKPVQRRILFAMWQDLGLRAGSRPRKSAGVVGDVIGKYHPHGDQAAYEAMVRMAQDFSLRYPLVHGEGNFGSLDGDGAAAYRYTEAKLTAIAEELLADLNADTVDFRPTFDAMREEPVVLPAAVPQLLINGSTGIAVGMATNIPPHNLKEVVAALTAMIDEPDLDVKGLLKHVKGPDFPTGGEILNAKRELRQIYEGGQGAVRLRGEYTVERLPRGKQQIVITSIPYAVNKAELVEAIAAEIIARKLPLVTDVRDESTTEVRIVLELKPDASPEAAMAYLYKHTALQTNFNVNLTCLVPTANPAVGQPARVTLRELCRHFLDHRMTVVTRRLEHERGKLRERLHILDALARIYDDLDRAIRIIRKAASRQEAADGLMKAFRLDQVQADAILEIRLYQLARLEIQKILDERDGKRARLREVEALLKSPKGRWKLIRDDLARVADQYGDERRTRIGGGEELEYDPEAYIVHEDATVLLSRDGWLRRVRELKDPSSARLREGDALQTVLVGSTRDHLVLYSTHGSLYVMRVADVPATTGYGEPVQSLLKFGDGERVVAAHLTSDAPAAAPAGQAVLPGLDVAARAPVLVATARGFGFRTQPDLSETTRAGRRLARVADGDEVVSVQPILGKTVVVAASNGKMLRFPVADVAELSGPGRGVTLLKPGEGERVVGALALGDKDAFIAVTPEGNERKLAVADVPAGRRAGKGQKVVKRGGVAAIRRVEE
ncbi:MAG TPA: DNA topoisomerase IV subunit A [Candidatus Limnocylindria bacterium]|nr:DNA topoisomerase IV subunit A [Candidatus Limnocylindria bacterium]